MKRILLLLIPISIGMASYKQNPTYSTLKKIINSKSEFIQRQYNDRIIYQLSEMIDRASSRYKVEPLALMAQIDHESGWNNYQKSLNWNWSVDYGLMQNNSEFIQDRCNKVLKRDCKYFELEDPILSMKLAFIKYDECRRYTGNSFLICYNNSDNAYKYLTSDFYPKYLEKIDVIYYQYQKNFK